MAVTDFLIQVRYFLFLYGSLRFGFIYIHIYIYIYALKGKFNVPVPYTSCCYAKIISEGTIRLTTCSVKSDNVKSIVICRSRSKCKALNMWLWTVPSMSWKYKQSVWGLAHTVTDPIHSHVNCMTSQIKYWNKTTENRLTSHYWI
jgi:hypothetical protein